MGQPVALGTEPAKQPMFCENSASFTAVFTVFDRTGSVIVGLMAGCSRSLIGLFSW